MTREKEIKRRLFEISTSNFNNSVVDSGAYFAGYIDGAEWADARPHWISVEDELPIDYEPVLAVVGGNHFAFVGICLNKTTWYCEIQNKATEIIGITHWMPLPEAPKGGKE